MGANWRDSGSKSRSGAGDLEVRTGSAGERIVPDLGTQYLRNRAQGWWFPLICAAELKQGREEFEALSAEGDGSGSALDGWPYKYAQDTVVPVDLRRRDETRLRSIRSAFDRAGLCQL
jgi:hypothetical protein